MKQIISVIGGLVGLVVLYFGATSAMRSLRPPADDSRYAQKMAAKIAETPNCQAYKQMILEAGKGSSTSAGTKHSIIKAYEAARKAGCGTET